MNLVMPWIELTGLIKPYATASKTSIPPFPVFTILRIHFMHQWFGISDPTIEKAFHDVALFSELAQFDAGTARLLEESTILKLPHLLEANNLALRFLPALTPS
jgi:IS5 family transposase